MDQAQAEVKYLEVGEHRIAYRKRDGAAPTLLFLPGYGSDMDGAKAIAVDRFAAERGLGALRFDYSGTGLSDGAFEDGTLDLWLSETMHIVETLTDGPLIVVGSSMGGWIALHVAMRLAERVRAILGIAAAPDFTDWGFNAQQRAMLKRNGFLANPVDQRKFMHGFWNSGQQLLLLGKPLEIHCPVRLVHGSDDLVVPVKIARRLKEQLRSADVQLTIVKGGGHRLSVPNEIATILRALAELVELVEPSP